MKLSVLLVLSALIATGCSKKKNSTATDKKAEQVEKKIDDIVPPQGNPPSESGQTPVTPAAQKRACSEQDVVTVLAAMTEIDSDLRDIDKEVDQIADAAPAKLLMKPHVIASLDIVAKGQKTCQDATESIDTVNCDQPEARQAFDDLNLTCGRFETSKVKLLQMQDLVNN